MTLGGNAAATRASARNGALRQVAHALGCDAQVEVLLLRGEVAGDSRGEHVLRKQ